eukprot:1132486-Ditylum_brightwellii.AAC.1
MSLFEDEGVEKAVRASVSSVEVAVKVLPSKDIVTQALNVRTYSNQKRLRKYTAGWKLQILWKDKSKSWKYLKDIKESHLIKVAECARVRGIDNEPAFVWW